ncbi:MAG: oligosaccharide flippase family protein, partial [Methyloligellaceae bacterium]
MTKGLTHDAVADRPSGGRFGALVARVADNPAFAKLLKTSTLIMGARLVGAVLGFGTQVALARLLGADALGTFYLALSLAGVMGILCGLGYPAITSRFVAEYRAEDKLDVLRAFVATTRRDTMLVALALLLLFGAGLLLWLGGSPE